MNTCLGQTLLIFIHSISDEEKNISNMETRGLYYQTFTIIVNSPNKLECLSISFTSILVFMMKGKLEPLRGSLHCKGRLLALPANTTLVFVPGKLFKPSLIFVGKARSLT
jgi:hypothetical protein